METPKQIEEESKTAPPQVIETPFITKQMKAYKPNDIDEFIRLEDGKYQKLIFGKPSTLYKKDERIWEAFKKWIKDEKKTVPCERFMNEETR
jgi:hypothetical protein